MTRDDKQDWGRQDWGRQDWNQEPAIEELIADPATQALMARDRVVPGELLALLCAARRRFAGDRAGS